MSEWVNKIRKITRNVDVRARAALPTRRDLHQALTHADHVGTCFCLFSQLHQQKKCRAQRVSCAVRQKIILAGNANA